MKDAAFFNRHGIVFLQAGQFKEAIQCFNQAIGLDPAFPDAYHNLGEAYTRLGQSVATAAGSRRERAAPDEETTSARDAAPDADSTDDLCNDLLSVSLNAIDNVWDELFANSPEEIDNVWDQCFSDPSENRSFPAILEFLDGRIENISQAVLFQPANNNDLALMDEGGGDGNRTFPLHQCSCIRMAGLPAEFAQAKDLACHVEILETINGKSYQKYIPDEQNLKNLILGFSRKKDNSFKYVLFPMINIRKRTQKRFIGEILIEKGMIDTPDFRHALEAYNQRRQLKFGQIIAKQAHILYPAVEVEIKNAYNNK
ncbi:MAG TPA: tetratricopeptide repeat protein, partial [Desulfobacteraceae bacterium]|nr:tetratricopeptide repeat protein [Desulfobacteraceae bacterium]